MDVDLFQDEAIAVFGRATFDPNAERTYDMMSDCFLWSDEALHEVARVCHARESSAFRFLLGYRSSLIHGKPDERLRPPWDQLLITCPKWPGFSVERCSTNLLQDLETARRHAIASIEQLRR